MRPVVEWIWDGPWWAPFVGALYFAILVAIAFGPVIGAISSGKKGS